MDTRVTIKSEIFTPEGISKIEENRGAKYVCDTCIGVPIQKLGEPTGQWNWWNYPVAVFYQSNPSLVPKDGSQYFGLYYKRHLPDSPLKGYICNAISAAQTPIVGVVADDGEIIYSHYRHDFRQSADKSVWIDGGRDYTRFDGNSPLVTLHIRYDTLVLEPTVKWGVGL